MAVGVFGSCGCLRHGAGAGLGSVLATVKAMAKARDGGPSVERSGLWIYGRWGETVPGNG